MKKLGLLTLLAVMSSNAFADGQVFYRYGLSYLSENRGRQTFTDTGAANGKNDDKSGHGFGAGLDLKLMNCPLFGDNSILGEIFVDYNRFSNNKVANAIDVVVSSDSSKKEVSVSELAVVVAPKYRFDGLGNFRPWIIPAGMAFLVNSPPSNTTNYLDIGYHAGVGAEYMIVKQLSVGIDYRYTMGVGDPQLKVKYSSLGANLGINF
jgi:opacity protein-like surface antigen